MFRRAEFRLAAYLLFAAAVGSALVASPASAQFRGGYAFLQAVDNRDGTKATEAINDDPALINTRHPDRLGMTPLMHAALLNYTEGAEYLADGGAPIDQTNRRGETALILAVQSRNVAMVRFLVRRGANPDKADHIAGLSARDYAKRDDRTGQIIALLDAKADTAERDFGPTFGPE
jgi:hypothetical protein